MISLAWIPGHIGISGNEAADSAARDATTLVSLVRSVLSLDFKIFCPSMRLGQLVTGLGPHTQGNKLRVVKPVIFPWRCCRSVRRDEVMVSRLVVGHIGLMYSNLLSANPSPVCAHCLIQLSVRHILLDCARLNVRCQRFHLPSTISNVLGDDPEIL
jgi:hypothetical protein